MSVKTVEPARETVGSSVNVLEVEAVDNSQGQTGYQF